MLENIYLCGINNNNCLHFMMLTVLWFAWKYLPLWYQQQQQNDAANGRWRCDLLENIYLCGINNNFSLFTPSPYSVVICLKISTFVVSTTTWNASYIASSLLWFAWKYLPLWYQQQHKILIMNYKDVVICLKISTFVVSTTTHSTKG